MRLDCKRDFLWLPTILSGLTHKLAPEAHCPSVTMNSPFLILTSLPRGSSWEPRFGSWSTCRVAQQGPHPCWATTHCFLRTQRVPLLPPPRQKSLFLCALRATNDRQIDLKIITTKMYSTRHIVGT